MNVRDLLLIVGSQIATAGVVLAHLGTERFSPELTAMQAALMLVAGLGLVVAGVVYRRQFGSVSGVFAQ